MIENTKELATSEGFVLVTTKTSVEYVITKKIRLDQYYIDEAERTFARDRNKIEMIKYLRSAAGISLGESKTICEDIIDRMPEHAHTDF